MMRLMSQPDVRYDGIVGEGAKAIFRIRVSLKYMANSEIMASRGDGPAMAKILSRLCTLTVAIRGLGPEFCKSRCPYWTTWMTKLCCERKWVWNNALHVEEAMLA